MAFGTGPEAVKGDIKVCVTEGFVKTKLVVSNVSINFFKCPGCMHVIYREENKTEQTAALCEAVNTNGCEFFFTTALLDGESRDVLAFLQLQEDKAKGRFYNGCRNHAATQA